MDSGRLRLDSGRPIDYNVLYLGNNYLNSNNTNIEYSNNTLNRKVQGYDIYI